MAVRGCNSVKPVVVLSKSNLGDRMQDLERLTSSVVMFLADLGPDRLQAFSYLFTKYDEHEVADIHNQLEYKYNHLVPREVANRAFVALLGDMVEKTAGDALGIQLINPSPGSEAAEILRKLATSPRIEDPNEVFRNFY